MILAQLITKWQRATLTEKSGAHSHFIDLCNVLKQPTPSNSDVSGADYAFEKHVTKTKGGKGFADVWMRGHFAWEYKSKGRSLQDAYDQINDYREALENPPLLVVCDFNRFEVHTNFTGTAKRVYAFTLADLAHPVATETCPLPPLDVLRALFEDPDRLRPDQVAAQVTLQAATDFGRVAASLRLRGHEPHEAAQFLIRVLFCLFAEDIGLLPTKLFTRLVENTVKRPDDFQKRLSTLFEAMEGGGAFGADDIKHFNGGLFADNTALPLTSDDLSILLRAAALNWAMIEPSIFGTLFERGLDPSKRAQLGAHYTSRSDILLIVEPVLMAPLRRRWAEVQTQALAVIARRAALIQARNERLDSRVGSQETKLTADLRRVLDEFIQEIAGVRVLDPACGSGNFLYVALRELLALENEVITFAIAHDAGGFFPRVGPEQMHGIELNEYAHELAPITVWIGYIQWLQDNGSGYPSEPILRRMDAIASMDAVMAEGEDGRPIEPVWPEADVIIGNPPFLGGNRIRQELGDDYVENLFRLYEGRVPAFADLVCYWFERTRELIAQGKVKRAGLLATNSIRGGANRKVLERIKASSDIFMAWADRPWVLDGAAVRVSMVGFDNGAETERMLDGLPAETINPDLTGTTNLTAAQVLSENLGLCFMGPSPKAPFDIDNATAQIMLSAPVNVNSRRNSDVVRPVASAVDLVRGSREKYTIDFGVMPEEQASEYELPFEYVKRHIYPLRQTRRDDFQGQWWRYARPRPEMRMALKGKRRFIATPAVSKHRIFVWVEPEVLCNQGTLVFTRDDDYFFGVLHSKPHELWALRMGTSLEDRPRYTPTTTFETFPFPWPPGQESQDDPKVKAIAAAARSLVEKRDAWLNPPDAAPTELAKRTLTALYNARPAFLDTLHRKLDEAVFAAYGWPTRLTEAEILERLLALNLERSGVPAGPQAIAEAEV